MKPGLGLRDKIKDPVENNYKNIFVTVQNLESGDDEFDGQDNDKTTARDQKDQSPDRKQNSNNDNTNKTLTNR